VTKVAALVRTATERLTRARNPGNHSRREASAPDDSAADARAAYFFFAIPLRERPLRSLRRRVADAIDPERRERLRTLLEDPLTGLANAYAWSRARSRLDDDPQLDIVTADIIGLKAVNDTGGHEAGNRLIRMVASMIGRVAGEMQIDPRGLFRAGGDEFVVAVPKGRGRDFARRLVRAVPARQIPGTHFQTGIRTGVGPTFHAADHAMTEARLREDVRHYREVLAGPGTRAPAEDDDQKLP
jgi:diguanylate cyclase (GGDEF)-like protein